MKKWNYKLTSGPALRKAIDDGDLDETLSCLIESYAELENLVNRPTISEDIDLKIEELRMLQSDDGVDEDEVDFELSEFYDLCDRLGAWVNTY